VKLGVGSRIVAILLFLCLAAAPSTDPTAGPRGSDPFETALGLWATGKQFEAEDFLDGAVSDSPEDVRLAFFRVACIRSQFDVSDALPIFSDIARRDAAGLYGKASLEMVYIDTNKDASAHLDELDRLSMAHPNDVMVLWMVGVGCRTLHKNELGIKKYEQLFELIAPLPGPVLAHQTCANLMDDAGRHTEALVHRKLAIQLDPASWCYDGLGNTLTFLRRWDEADSAFEKSTSMMPHDEQYWRNWIISMYARGDTAGLARIRQRRDAALASSTQP
jgi:tetratricopeptide (TPR) repeat protein